MSKLAAQDKFLDLSDYGRSFGRFFALQLKETRFTPIHVTLLFGISGLFAIYCILNQYFLAQADSASLNAFAAFFIAIVCAFGVNLIIIILLYIMMYHNINNIEMLIYTDDSAFFKTLSLHPQLL